MFKLCDDGSGPFTFEQSKEYHRLYKIIAESRHCPECAAHDGSLQRLMPHELASNPDEYGGSECGTCEEFVVWGQQCEYEWAHDEGHSDADPGL